MCKAPLEEAKKKLLEDCYPEEPTDCELKYETAYADAMEQCLANGGTDVICTP